MPSNIDQIRQIWVWWVAAWQQNKHRALRPDLRPEEWKRILCILLWKVRKVTASLPQPSWVDSQLFLT
jgi:hypothetical protein